METTAVQEMQAFLLERYGISTYRELLSRIEAAPRINLAIFNEVIQDDDSASANQCRTKHRQEVG